MKKLKKVRIDLRKITVYNYAVILYAQKRMNTITYPQALKHLNGSYAKGAKAGLDCLRRVLAVLGNPHRQVPTIHVAGTNGKGSVCAFLQSILAAAGYRVGLFTSPHLVRYNERFVLNGIPISDDDFADCLGAVVRAAAKAGVARLSFFEWLTLMGFHYFAKEKAAFAIIETGIGGRLDATNVLDSPLLSVLTTTGYDHQDMLGETLSEIAAEEAGIIKNNCPAALYPATAETLPVFTRIAREKEAKLYHLGQDYAISDCDFSLQGTTFTLKSAYFLYTSLSIPLLGKHQVHNAVHALLCVHALREHTQTPVKISEEAVREGLRQCRWPGRFQIVREHPYIVLDGAHNEEGAGIFAKTLTAYFPHRPRVLVIGFSRGRDAEGIMGRMLPAADCVICTQPKSYRALPAVDLHERIRRIAPSMVTACEPDCRKALEQAAAQAGTAGVVAVVGSLYLVGDIIAILDADTKRY